MVEQKFAGNDSSSPRERRQSSTRGKGKDLTPRRGEVWKTKLGNVLILQNDVLNESRHVSAIGLPVRESAHSTGILIIDLEVGYVCIDQPLTVEVPEDLKEKTGTVSAFELEEIAWRLRQVLAI